MNVEEITKLFDTAAKLMKDALRYILDKLPNQTYSFEHTVRLPYTSSYTGETTNVNIEKICIDASGYINVHFVDDYNNIEVVDLEDFNKDAAYWILQSIEPNVLFTIPSYRPQPQTLLITGVDNVDEYYHILRHDSDDEIRDFIETFRSDIVVRSFCTEQERKAYIMGIDDATGYETALIDNDKGNLDIDI